jgi:hypothetical protein
MGWNTKMNNRFDLEQQIMNCWHVVDDIKTLNQQLQDASSKMTEDQIANYLLGLETIYQVKFEQLFALFEQMIADRTIT